MNQKQQNRLMMNKAVANLNKDNQEIWQRVPAFARAQEELVASIMGRDKAAQVQSVPTTGATTGKQADAADAIDKILSLAKSCAAYAMETANHDLYARMSFAKYLLLRMPDNEQVATLTEMMRQIDAHAEQLGDYGVTKEAVAAAHAALDRVDTGITAPRSITDAGAAATKSVLQWEAQSYHALGIMDRLVHVFAEKSPDFVRQYRQARIIVDSGMRHDNNPDIPNA